MSRLIISENLFLEVAELNQNNKFMKEDGYVPLIKAMIKNPGILSDGSYSYFKVYETSGVSNSVTVSPGIAYTGNLDRIVSKEAQTFNIPNDGTKRWIILSRAVSHYEDGTVTINADGSLVGVGTLFTEVLRGQPNFPNKVKFNSETNTGTYEVVSVTNDTNAIIAGAVTPESNLKYSVIGTFTPGFVPLSENEEIYEYDSCAIQVIASATRPSVSDDQFILAGVSYDAATGNILISDERIYYMFNNPYTQSDTGGEGTTKDAINPICSLLSVKNIGLCGKGAEFELIFETCYTINQFQLIQTSTNNIFNILSGSCNFLGSGTIPNGYFTGWLLVNRKNMKYAEITNNENKEIWVPVLDTDIIEETGNDFIIIPNFQSVEFKVVCSNNVDNPSVPYYAVCPMVDGMNRVRFNLYYPSTKDGYENEVEVKLSYRLKDDTTRNYPYHDLGIASFNNVDGQVETLSQSSFTVNIQDIEPQEKLRNYS